MNTKSLSWTRIGFGEYQHSVPDGSLVVSHTENGAGPTYKYEYRPNQGRTIQASWSPKKADRVIGYNLAHNGAQLLKYESAFKDQAKGLPAGIRSAIRNDLLKLLKVKVA